MSDPILEAIGLQVDRGGRRVLDVPALAVEPGEVLGVLGPNGAGKSTLLRCLAFLERPTAGIVRLRGNGLAWREAVTYRRQTATVFQEPLLLDTTAFDNVAIGLRLRGVSRPQVERRVRAWLERLGIAHLAGRSARTLSGGEARRVSLARALVLEPAILFLDEPFSALDAPTRATVIRDLAAVLVEQQTTTLFVTHDQAEARALADRLIVLLDGRIAQVGEVSAVFERPADRRVLEFLHSADLPERRGSIRVA